MLSLQDFIAQNTGKIIGDTPENKGQCTGASECWLDNLGLNTPHLYGNAKDLLVNADTTKFTVIQNTPTNAPSLGDVLVWGSAWGGGFGHTAVVLQADVNTVTVFEQNNPLGSPCLTATHMYDGVIGWLHPLTLPNTTNQSVTGQQLQDQLNNQIQATSQCQSQLTMETDRNTHLTQDKQVLQTQLDDVKSERNALNDEVLNLKNQLEKIHKEDLDYGLQAQKYSKLADNRLSYLVSVADTLEIPINPDDAVLADEINADIQKLLENQKPITPPPPVETTPQPAVTNSSLLDIFGQLMRLFIKI